MKNALIMRRRSTTICPGLMAGAALLGGRSAAERRMGRYMRAPDDHPGGGFDFPDEVDSLDGVPERARFLYLKDEATGKFKYDDVSKLRSALEHEKAARRSAAQKAADAKKWEELGKTPEEIKELLEAQANAEEDRLKKAGDFDSLKAQLESNHAAELAKREERISALTKQIEKLMYSDQVKTVLADKDVEGNPTLLMGPLRDRVKIEEDSETGEFRMTVLNADGHPMLNSSNQPATLKDLALQFKSDENYAGAFKGVNQSGGGTPNKQGGGAPINGKKRGEMTTSEKTAFIREHGHDEYNKLPY